MPTDVSLFDYALPKAMIAQHSVSPRDHSRLLVLDRKTGKTSHRRFDDIVDELRTGDVLVFNVTKVFKARLREGKQELFLLKVRDGEAECLIRPGKKYPAGSTLSFFGHDFLIATVSQQGIVIVKTCMTADEMMGFCDIHGEVPTPPYVTSSIDDFGKYQTVYAKHVGSVAAPTAGFHFTRELLERIAAKGVQIEEVTLHVGIGTFRPVQTSTIEEHVMHAEWVQIEEGVAERIVAAKAEGRRVIAVGTTTVRALEGVVAAEGELRAFAGEINMFITPGFTFRVIDGLVTNFHLPKSTLLMLVSAFAGRENVLAAYEEAKQLGYRFFSFGDAMFIA